MSESLKSSRSCAPIPESEGGDQRLHGGTGSKSSPADGGGIWAEAEAAARTSNGRNERIFQGSSGQYRVQYTMTENPPINNDGKVPARSKVAHPIRVPGRVSMLWSRKVDAQTYMASINSPGAPSLTPQPAASTKRLLPWLVAVAFFMESLDTTILNTAVPTISAALHVTPLSMKSVLASYTLSLAVFIPISGWMADRFGTRRVFASAIGLFTLGSFLCGVSTNIHLLVACRILQGCGGAMMVPVGRLTLVRTFAKSELIRAMSFVAIPGLVGPMLGPVAGGPHRRILSLAADLLSEYTDRHLRSADGLSPSAGLSRRAHPPARYRWAHPLRFGDRPAVLRAGNIRGTCPERARDPGTTDHFALLCSRATYCMPGELRFLCCS